VIHHRHRIRESATSPFVRDVYPCEEETDEGLQEVLGIMTALTASSDPSVRLIAAIVSAVAPGACSVRPETIRMLGIRDFARMCQSRAYIVVSRAFLTFIGHSSCLLRCVTTFLLSLSA
jgi:hypothetical protein